ncbi:MAG: lipopolysaccharide transport periplasmic protein LptA, partial [Luteimonas sp.]|nr:lipopolysaccharide transport periplasmic protein LptA [Luteimonas sp.]
DIQSSKADVRRGGNQQVIKLTGSPVKMKQQMDDGGWMNATAAQIDYDQNRDTVVFSGNAVVQQPSRGSISGERIVYNMGTGQVQSGAAAGASGRVNMTFEPKNKAPARETKAEPAQDQN